MEDRLTVLYERILEFEAVAVYHCVRNTASRFIRNVVGKEDWQDKVDLIESLKLECEGYLPMIDRESNLRLVQKVTTILQQQADTIERFVKRSIEQQDELLRIVQGLLTSKQQGRPCNGALEMTYSGVKL